jgi:hypothetical protein
MAFQKLFFFSGGGGRRIFSSLLYSEQLPGESDNDFERNAKEVHKGVPRGVLVPRRI